jgi:hypothetical protein
MTAVEQLRERLLERVPEATDEYTPPIENLDDPPPASKVVITALGGRPRVELDARAFERLLTQAGGISGPDLTACDLGRLLTAAKQHGPRHLLDALLWVRAASPIYTLKTTDGRLWRPSSITNAMQPHPEYPVGAAQ